MQTSSVESEETATASDAGSADAPGVGGAPTARRALSTFAIYLVAQVLGGAAVRFAAGIAFVVEGGSSSDSASLEERTKGVAGLAAVGGMMLGGLAVAWRELGGRRTRDPGFRRAVGWRPARPRVLASSLAFGAVVALAYLVVVNALWPLDSTFEPGPMARMALTAGWQQQVWSVAVLALSPPIEEFLFRGVLLAGFASAWGIGVASVLTTVLFVSMHSAELVAYPPATLGILALGCFSLAARLRSGSLGPPIAVHLGYNLALVVLTMLSQPASSPD